jgi:hypothetical protein
LQRAHAERIRGGIPANVGGGVELDCDGGDGLLLASIGRKSFPESTRTVAITDISRAKRKIASPIPARTRYSLEPVK